MSTTPRVSLIMKQASSAARLHKTRAQKLVLTVPFSHFLKERIDCSFDNSAESFSLRVQKTFAHSQKMIMKLQFLQKIPQNVPPKRRIVLTNLPNSSAENPKIFRSKSENKMIIISFSKNMFFLKMFL